MTWNLKTGILDNPRVVNNWNELIAELVTVQKNIFCISKKRIRFSPHHSTYYITSHFQFAGMAYILTLKSETTNICLSLDLQVLA